jgi:hypothetical protein
VPVPQLLTVASPIPFLRHKHSLSLSLVSTRPLGTHGLRRIDPLRRSRMVNASSLSLSLSKTLTQPHSLPVSHPSPSLYIGTAILLLYPNLVKFSFLGDQGRMDNWGWGTGRRWIGLLLSNPLKSTVSQLL